MASPTCLPLAIRERHKRAMYRQAARYLAVYRMSFTILGKNAYNRYGSPSIFLASYLQPASAGCAKRKQCAGVLTPRVLNGSSHGLGPVVDGAKLLSGGVRVSRRGWVTFLLGGSLALLGSIFSIFFVLGCVLGASCAFLSDF